MKRTTLIILAIALFIAVTPALAQGNKFRVFAGVAYVMPSSEENRDIDGVYETIKATDEPGWTVGFEWRATKWFGLELDYIDSTQDIEFGGVKIAQIDYKPLSLSANFHVVHTKIVDFWVAPTYSYVMWGDIEEVNGGNVPTDSSNGLAATVGMDLSFFKFMAVNLGLRYSWIDIEPSQDSSSEVNPLMARAGLSFRF